jgi:hypothetical protein
MTGTVRGRAALVPLALAAALSLPLRTAATHLPDHRFLVIGYVTDAAGRPVAGARVVVRRPKTGLEQPTRTEPDGLYFVVVHLHDEDEGERLAVEANGVQGEIRARFDVRDRRVERGTRVDIRGTRLVENRGGFAETLREYLAR